VTAAGGEIEALSDRGQGTTLRVILPRSKGIESRSTPAGRAPSTPSTARGRVLVVDDEQMIVDMLARVLGPTHDVSTHTDGGAAIARIREGARFDVILCDLMMPAMSGMAVHAALARVAPEQVERMIFLTGGAFTADAKSFLDNCGAERMEKPFDLKAL